MGHDIDTGNGTVQLTASEDSKQCWEDCPIEEYNGTEVVAKEEKEKDINVSIIIQD